MPAIFWYGVAGAVSTGLLLPVGGLAVGLMQSPVLVVGWILLLAAGAIGSPIAIIIGLVLKAMQASRRESDREPPRRFGEN